MDYCEQVRTHFRHPRHTGTFSADEPGVTTAQVGKPLQGGVIRLQIKIDQDRISAVRQQVYGSGYLIAAASWLADWLHTRRLADAATFDKQLLEDALQLPPTKLHCAVLAEQALHGVLSNLKD